MGKGDNRLTRKMRQRHEQAKKKAKERSAKDKIAKKES